MKSVHWWEEAEARALRQKGAAQMALIIWQRLRDAGMDPALALLPSYGLAQSYMQGCDLVQLVDSLLVAPAGTVKLHLTELLHWCRGAHWAVEQSARPFLVLIDSLKLVPDRPEPAEAAEREEATERAEGGGPEEQAKRDGRYRRWHLLFERLDLKLESEGLAADLRVPLARELAEVYEEYLVLIRELSRLLPETPARWRRWSRLLSDYDAAFHYHLGPRRLAAGRVTGSAADLGLQTRLLTCLAAL